MKPIEIGKNILQKDIGSGVFVTVYKAADRTGEIVSIIALKPELFSDPHVIACFCHEVLSASNLFHPQIVNVINSVRKLERNPGSSPFARSFEDVKEKGNWETAHKDEGL